MLVNDRMLRHPIMISPETPAAEIQKIMSENKIRHLPVVGDGKRLVGLVTRQRMALKPDQISSLNVWEITRILSNLTAKDLMVKKKDIITITSDRTVERAAKLMSENKISCLPVVDEDKVVVGIITETDLLQAFQDMLGLPAQGVRVTVRMPDRKGEFIKLTSVFIENGWGLQGIGSFPSPRHPGYYEVVLKIPHVSKKEIKQALSKIPDQSIADIRDVV